jgi:hypothetical protein
VHRLFSYRDAVTLLGSQSGLVRLIDKASVLGLLGVGAIDLFDVRAEVVKLGEGLIKGLRDRVGKLARYDRTQRLAAAHAVVVVTAYFEVLGELDLVPKGLLTREDQVWLVDEEPAHPWVERLIDAELPIPAPQRPYEDVLNDLAHRYLQLSKDLLELLEGLEFWDRLDSTARDQLRGEAAEVLPERACRRYEEIFRQLATDFPEVACWANLVDHGATRLALARGLAGLQERLTMIASGRTPTDRLAALVRANRAALDQPMVPASDVQEGMVIPPLAVAYVNPGFRVLPPAHDRHPADEAAWIDRPRRDDLNEFLAGHLTLPQAVQAPLLVLGQPGAGKSALTRVLAARLPPGDFLPIRVELRGVPADSDVLAQLEHAIRDALDESMSWPELTQAAAGTLPIVMLDGFDELLQATGVNEADYLERVADFQQRQAERNRPLAMIVTSRTAVADRARLPRDVVVLRLEPFDDEQVTQWVNAWNQSNSPYFTSRSIEPLSARDVLTVPDLAGQPLLLLMLALYDADGNALRLTRSGLNEAELYERLLWRFAEREVSRSCPGIADDDLARAVEEELLRLSVTAFAMFNRGRQWVTDIDLDADLTALFGPMSQTPGPYGFRRRLTMAEGVIGGFFFVHKAQALREQQRLKAYEFLHATFGEYLVARLVIAELADIAEELAFAASRKRPTTPDDAFLHALLSFAVLTSRASIVAFLRHGVSRIPDTGLLRGHLCAMFARALNPRNGARYDDYRPSPASGPARYACFSANLLLLALLTTSEPTTGAELFAEDGPGLANEAWRRIARLWHSQLPRAEWNTLIRTIRVSHVLRDGERDVVVRLSSGDGFPITDLSFFSGASQPLAAHHSLSFSDDDPLAPWMREITFRDDTLLGALFLQLLPYVAGVSRDIHTTWQHHEIGVVQSPADLLALLLIPMTDVEERFLTYLRALDTPPNTRYVDIVLKQLEEDYDGFPTNVLVRLYPKWAAAVVKADDHAVRERADRLLQRLRDRRDLERETRVRLFGSAPYLYGILDPMNDDFSR